MNPTPDRATMDAYEQLRKLQLVTEAALSHLGLEELFDELLERTRSILDADTCAVLLLDEATNELVARAAKGIEEEVERGVRIPVGKGFAGAIAATRKPLAVPDVDHSNVLNPILRERGIKSLLGAPLMSEGRVLGVIHVGTLHPRIFTDAEHELLSLAAERAAQGLERALVVAELQRLDELKRNFVALASHELRTPAAAVYGAAATLFHQRDRISAEDVDQLVAVLYAQSERLARLTEQLLDLSRLDAARVPIRIESIDLRIQLEGLVRSLDANEPQPVEIDVPRGLTVEADRDALDRIVSNLVINAHRHGEPPVRVVAQTRDSHLRLAVEDNGAGVTAAIESHLFEPFQRSPEAAARGGSGLGLSIARLYTQALGGELVYERREQGGSRFELVLPLVQAAT